MIDFHSHILPCVDDGSASVDESVELLRMLYSQGVSHVFATPHFDASCDTPRSFFDKREAAHTKLMDALRTQEQAFPTLLLGAEVMYFSGISGMSELTEFTLGSTNLLLLEMPIGAWSEYAVQELVNLCCSGKFTVLVAHVERYFQYQSASVWRRLLESGILTQANASFFAEPQTRRRALKMLMRGEIQLLGSDCHNLSSRPPRMDEALSVIEKKLGTDFVFCMDSFGKSFLN